MEFVKKIKNYLNLEELGDIVCPRCNSSNVRKTFNNYTCNTCELVEVIRT